MKSPIAKFTKELKQMHPMYAMYLLQRLRADIEVIREHVPALYKEDRKATEDKKIPLFHPAFYINYANVVADILNDACDYEIEPLVEPIFNEIDEVRTL